MRAPLTRDEIVLGLAVLAGHDRYTPIASADPIDALRIGCQIYAAQEAARDVAPETPRHSMGKFIRVAMTSGDLAQLEHAFALCVSAVPTNHDVKPAEPVSREVAEWAAAMQRSNGRRP